MEMRSSVNYEPMAEIEISADSGREGIEQLYQAIAAGERSDAQIVRRLMLLRYHEDSSDYIDTNTLRQLLADNYPVDCTVPLEHLDTLCRLTSMTDLADEELTLLDEHTRNQFITLIGMVAGLAALRQRRLNSSTIH